MQTRAEEAQRLLRLQAEETKKREAELARLSAEAAQKQAETEELQMQRDAERRAKELELARVQASVTARRQSPYAECTELVRACAG